MSSAPVPWNPPQHDRTKTSGLAGLLGMPELVAAVLVGRGLAGADEVREHLSPRLGALPPPDGMAGLEAAVERLARAVRAGERVAVYGDYDADGLTAVALAVTVLRRLGLDVRPWLASRFEGGYGLSRSAVEQVVEDQRSLLLVLDCGTSDLEAIAAARREGLDVVVIDHHPPTGELPHAAALVNPHRDDCTFPDKGLAAVGLVFYVLGVLRTRLGADLDIRETLDLVAVGTVADVAPLTGANRILVSHGLARLESCPRPGLAALRALGRAGARVDARAVGFQIAPRINAAGRLGDPAVALDLLLAEGASEAVALAARLDRLSTRRRALEETILTAALPAACEQVEAGRAGLLVAARGWSPGVVGIVAARLSERFARPVAVVAIDRDEGTGSARAPEGVDLHQVLALCADRLTRFGGHAAAAGFAVSTARLDGLPEAFAAAVETCRGLAPPAGPRLEAVLEPGDLTLEVASWMGRLGPFGAGNPEPLLLLRGGRVLRSDRRSGGHLSLLVAHGGVRTRAFAPRMADRWPACGAEPVDLAVGLRVDDYRVGGVELHVAFVRPS